MKDHLYRKKANPLLSVAVPGPNIEISDFKIPHLVNNDSNVNTRDDTLNSRNREGCQ